MPRHEHHDNNMSPVSHLKSSSRKYASPLCKGTSSGGVKISGSSRSGTVAAPFPLPGFPDAGLTPPSRLPAFPLPAAATSLLLSPTPVTPASASVETRSAIPQSGSAGTGSVQW